jgi:hypothetical protein
MTLHYEKGEKTVHPMDGMFEHPRTDLLRVVETFYE